MMSDTEMSEDYDSDPLFQDFNETKVVEPETTTHQEDVKKNGENYGLQLDEHPQVE